MIAELKIKKLVDMHKKEEAILKQQYQYMKQNLRKHFPNAVNEIERKDKIYLPNAINSLIDSGLKVIVLDDGTLTQGLKEQDIQGKSGKDYAVISAESKKPLNGTTIQFANLNAMALMGVGVLYSDTILFETAYRLFTGREAPANIIEALKRNTLWIIRALPRIVKFTGTMQDMEELQQLFRVSA